MSLYANVEEGSVVALSAEPVDGWLPVNDQRPEIGPGETWTAFVFTVGESSVLMTADTQPIPEM